MLPSALGSNSGSSTLNPSASASAPSIRAMLPLKTIVYVPPNDCVSVTNVPPGNHHRRAGGHQPGGAVAFDDDEAAFHQCAADLATEKLSPQPHSASAFGFLNFSAALMPSRT